MSPLVRPLALAVAALGLAIVAIGGVNLVRANEGLASLDAVYEAQDVTLSYDADGQLTDRGTTEGAEAIMALLTEDWKYPVVESDMNPDDPLVNTASEYMYQMAVISYHTLHGTQTIVLDEDVEYNGVVYPAGSYDFEVDGRYWTDFDRRHPIEGPARAAAWTGTAHALVAELGVGTITHSSLQMGLGLSGAFAGFGATLLLAGLGLIWTGRAKDEDMFPDTVPEGLARKDDDVLTS